MGEEQAKPFDLPPGPRRSHGESNEGGSCPDHGDELFAAHQPGDDEAASAREGEGVVHCTHANHQAITVFPLAAAQQAAAAHSKVGRCGPGLWKLRRDRFPLTFFWCVLVSTTHLCAQWGVMRTMYPLACLLRHSLGLWWAFVAPARAMCGCVEIIFVGEAPSAGSVDNRPVRQRFGSSCMYLKTGFRQTAAGAVSHCVFTAIIKTSPGAVIFTFTAPPLSIYPLK